MSNKTPMQEGKQEVHVGFKFSLGEILHIGDLGQIDSYRAHPERTFEAAYNWTDETYNLHDGWTDNLYDSLDLPEVNVVVSGYFAHPVVASKLGETCTPIGTIRESEILAYMSPQKTTVVIQGDALHDAKQFTCTDGSNSLISALMKVKNEIAARTNNLRELVNHQEYYTKKNMPPVAMQEGFRILLQECDAKGVVPFQDYHSKTNWENSLLFLQQYAREYLKAQSSNIPMTQNQLIYSNIVKAAGECTTSASIENKQIFEAIQKRAMEKLEDVNRDVHYAQLTQDALLQETLRHLPEPNRSLCTDVWQDVQKEIQEKYPEKSPQWQALETQYETVQFMSSLLPDDIVQVLCYNHSVDFNFIHERESAELDEIDTSD